MKTRLIGIVLTIVVLVGSAYGDAIFYPLQQIPIGGGNERVINSARDTVLPTMPLLGTVPDAPEVMVHFTSTTDTLSGGGGQCCITAQDGLINNIEITWPGFGVKHIIFNPFKPRVNGDLIVTVSFCTPQGEFCVDPGFKTLKYGAPTGNQNYMTIITVDGEVLTSVRVESAGGFEEFNQVRVDRSTITSIPPINPDVIPEPTSIMLVGSGLLVVTQAIRRKLKDAS